MCQAVFTICQVVVKGYHECPFAVEDGERFVASPVVPTRNTWLVSAYLNLSIRWCVNTGRNVSSGINLFLICADSGLAIIICKLHVRKFKTCFIFVRWQ